MDTSDTSRPEVPHSKNCNVFLDDESDQVLADYRECTCGADPHSPSSPGWATRYVEEARDDESLGTFLHDLMHKVEEAGGPNDECVLCGRKAVLLHPVGKAWACSRCHHPEDAS